MGEMSPRTEKMVGDRLVERWDGGDYERHSAHQRRWGGDLIAELALRGDERVLDLGCGDGALTRELADRLPCGSVLGIDAAEEMLETARTKCSRNMSVMLLDINAIDFRDEFDVVFSNAALHWTRDHGAVLRNAHQALRPGGILRVQFGGDGNCPNLTRCARRHMTQAPFLEAFARFRWPWFFPTLAEYEVLLSAAAFSEWRAWLERKDQRFPNAESIIGWIDNPCLIPFLGALPPHLRRPFRDAVVADMLDQTRRPDDTYLEPFFRMNVWARKGA